MVGPDAANLDQWPGVLFRHKKKVFFAILSAAIVTVAASLLVPRRYTATAVLEMRNHKTPDTIHSGAVRPAANPTAHLSGEDLVQRSAVERVIDELQLAGNPPRTRDGELAGPGRLAKDLRIDDVIERIAVKYLPRTAQVERVRVSFTDRDREVACTVVNRLADLCVQLGHDRIDRQLMVARDSVEDQVAQYRHKLSSAEAAKTNFEAEHPGLDPSDPASADARLVELNAKLARIDEQVNLITQKRKALREWAEREPDHVVRMVNRTNPVLEQRRQRKEQLEGQLFDLKRKPGMPTERHPSIVRLRQSIKVLEEQIASIPQQVQVEGESITNVERLHAMRDVEVMGGELAALTADRQVVVRQVRECDDERRQLVQLRNRYATLKRDVDEYRQHLDFWLGQSRQTRIALAVEFDKRPVSLAVIQRPQRSNLISFPSLSQVLLAALVVGLGAGAVVLVLANMLDRSLHGVQHTAGSLNLPVLGAVDEIVTPTTAFRRGLISWCVFPAAGAAMVAVLIVTIFLVRSNLLASIPLVNLAGPPEALVFGGDRSDSTP